MELLKQADLKPVEKRFEELGIPRETIQREISFAMQAINKSPQLSNCTMRSKMEAVLNIANTGLTLNPVMSLAYLVPRYTSGQMVCTLQPSYQGLVKVLTDSGSVLNVEAHTIHENDRFEYTLGTDAKITHSPAFGKDRGKVTGVYAVATLHNGKSQVEVMDLTELESIRDMSESYKAMKAGKIKSCVWVDHFGEMCRKTVIRRIAKYLPKTAQWEKAAKVIDLDNQDFIVDPFGWKALRIEELASLYSGSPRHDAIIKRIPTMTESEADKILAELERDAPNEVTERGMINHQGKVSAHVKNIANSVD